MEGLASFGGWLKEIGAADLASVFGLVVAIIGIWLTLVQLVLLRRQLRLDSLIKIMDSNRALVSIGFDHPVVWTAMDAAPSTMLAEEARAQARYVQLWLNHIHVIWGAWQARLVSRSEWEAYRLDMVDGFRLKALREHWKKLSKFYPAEFRKLVASVTKEDAGDPGIAV